MHMPQGPASAAVPSAEPTSTPPEGGRVVDIGTGLWARDGKALRGGAVRPAKGLLYRAATHLSQQLIWRRGRPFARTLWTVWDVPLRPSAGAGLCKRWFGGGGQDKEAVRCALALGTRGKGALEIALAWRQIGKRWRRSSRCWRNVHRRGPCWWTALRRWRWCVARTLRDTRAGPSGET